MKRQTLCNDTSVLVLNASYEPLNFASAKRALGLVYKGKAAIEEDLGIISIHGHRLPCVIRLVKYRKIPHRHMELSRRNIYIRDNYTCQYCGVSYPARMLTWDHVVPRSKGGRNSWDNLVTACQSCNQKKGDRDLSELEDMKLIRVPRALTVHTSRHLIRKMGASNEKQRKYLYF